MSDSSHVFADGFHVDDLIREKQKDLLKLILQTFKAFSKKSIKTFVIPFNAREPTDLGQ
jgi:hypothetical protein